MKIRMVRHNNRKKMFEVQLGKQRFMFPFAKANPRPSPDDPVTRVFVDDEVGREAFTYVLRSGGEGTVHLEQVLDYNADPSYLRDVLLYRLTIEAQKRIGKSPLAKREIIRRLRTSPAQLYRLLEPTNYRKSVDQLVSLLRILDCNVDFVVRGRTA